MTPENEDYINEEDALKLGFASDLELKMAGSEEYSTAYEVKPDHMTKLALACFAVTVLSYACCRIFGKIVKGQHNGLSTFWKTMMLGEVFSCAASFLVVFALQDDNKHETNIVCSEFEADFSIFQAYSYLFLWVIFVMSILRSVTSITWLHRVTDVSRLIDMGRGVGILAFSLLFLIPLSLIGRHTIAELKADGTLTICLPVWTPSLSSNTFRVITTTAYLVGGLIAHIMETCRKIEHSSKLASVLVVLTHFAPTFFFSSWISVVIQKKGYPDMFPVIYCLACALNSLSNVCCYKLYLLSYPDEPSLTKHQHSEISAEFKDGKQESDVHDPPGYTEK